MLVLLSIIIVAFVSCTNVSGAENPYVQCQIEGDPRLLPFTLIQNANATKVFCGLRNAPVTFFRNKYIKIEVINDGNVFGNIISFIVSFLEESTSDDDVCTFTEYYFKSSVREFTCGSARISINESMHIQYPEADLSIKILNGVQNYNIDLWTSWENANRSRGMCHDGCTKSYTTSVRSALLTRPIPKDQTTSLLAEQICDVYFKEYTKSNSHVPVNLIQFVETTRQGCITDVTTMGDKKYAEQALASIVSIVMTLNATSLEQIQKRTQQASVVVNGLSKIADQITAQLVANHRGRNLISN